jgi:hypothetical protein
MSAKTMHMSLSVRGALKWPARMRRGLFRDIQTGRTLDADEAHERLLDLLSQGVELLPMGKCDGHNPKTGCPGHAVAPDEVSP